MMLNPLGGGSPPDIAALIAQELAALADDAQTLASLLSPGDVVAATVLPSNGLTDLLDVGGLRVAAALPPSLVPGERISVRVTGFDGDRINLQIVPAPDDTPAPSPTRTRSAPATAAAAPLRGGTLPAASTARATPQPGSPVAAGPDTIRQGTTSPPAPVRAAAPGSSPLTPSAANAGVAAPRSSPAPPGSAGSSQAPAGSAGRSATPNRATAAPTGSSGEPASTGPDRSAAFASPARAPARTTGASAPPVAPRATAGPPPGAAAANAGSGRSSGLGGSPPAPGAQALEARLAAAHAAPPSSAGAPGRASAADPNTRGAVGSPNARPVVSPSPPRIAGGPVPPPRTAAGPVPPSRTAAGPVPPPRATGAPVPAPAGSRPGPPGSANRPQIPERLDLTPISARPATPDRASIPARPAIADRSPLVARATISDRPSIAARPATTDRPPSAGPAIPDRPSGTARPLISERPPMAAQRAPEANASALNRPAGEETAMPTAAPRGVGAFRQPAALLRALGLPVNPVNLATARSALESPAKLPGTLAALDRVLAAADGPGIATLRTVTSFLSRLDPRSPVFGTQIAAFVDHVVTGRESKLSGLLQSADAAARGLGGDEAAAPHGSAAPPHAAAERAAALRTSLDFDLKTQLLVAAEREGAGTAAGADTDALGRAVTGALTAVTAVQLHAAAALGANPDGLAFSLPVALPDGFAQAHVRIDRDAPGGKPVPLDGDNFHIAFVLETRNLGTVAIEMMTVGRAVTLSVKTEAAVAARAFGSALATLTVRLESLRYRIAKADAAVAPPAPAAKPESPNRPPPGGEPARLVDVDA